MFTDKSSQDAFNAVYSLLELLFILDIIDIKLANEILQHYAGK
jgi:hypothetical protein